MMQATIHNGAVIEDRAATASSSHLQKITHMKTTHLLLATAFAFALPASLHAAKDPAKKEAKKAARQLIGQYDTNKNGAIDGDEIDALKKAFDNDKTGPLKQFDTNGDGKLDDNEVAAIHGGKKGDKAGKKADKAAK